MRQERVRNVLFGWISVFVTCLTWDALFIYACRRMPMTLFIALSPFPRWEPCFSRVSLVSLFLSVFPSSITTVISVPSSPLCRKHKSSARLCPGSKPSVDRGMFTAIRGVGDSRCWFVISDYHLIPKERETLWDTGRWKQKEEETMGNEERKLNWNEQALLQQAVSRSELKELKTQVKLFVLFITFYGIMFFFFLNSLDLLSFLTLVILFIYYLSKSVFCFKQIYNLFLFLEPM